MPWCDNCGREVQDHELVASPSGAQHPTEKGASEQAGPLPDSCPVCGRVIGKPSEADSQEVHPKAPWHFKLLVVGSVGYLGYRLYQGIGWLIHHA